MESINTPSENLCKDNSNYTFAGKPRDMDIEGGFMGKLHLHPFTSLESLNSGDRGECPKCKSSRKFYCYDCMVPLTPEGGIPTLCLPVDVTVIRHPAEKRSKSSIIPAKLLAPTNVEILHTIEVPE